MYAGSMQVRVHGIWGGVCGRFSQDRKSADVFCRELGYQGVVMVTQNMFWYSSASVPNWISQLKCDGKEKTLLNCTTIRFNSEGNTCPSNQDYLRNTVVCTPKGGVTGNTDHNYAIFLITISNYYKGRNFENLYCSSGPTHS